MTDLGGSLAVASRGLFATGVSTDLSGESNDRLCSMTATDCCKVTYLSSGGKVGDLIRAEVTCDKCMSVHAITVKDSNIVIQLVRLWRTHPSGSPTQAMNWSREAVTQSRY